MKYYLDDSCTLCGWKNLPFAVYNARIGQTGFVGKEEFIFLFSCNGKKDVDLSQQSDRVRKYVEWLMESGELREAKNGETRTLVYHEYPGLFKEEVQWSLTGKCNYRCRHCFQSAPEGVLGEPTHEQIFDIIHQFRKNGIHSVSLTGGEPLIRSDFFEIVDELIRNDIRISTIFSNGALITEDWLNRLEERKVHPSFQISFDGIGYHDWMRGVPGAEQRAREAIRLLHGRDYAVSSAMCLCRENVGAIRETVKVLAADGCRSIKFQRAMPQGEWCSQAEHYLTVGETMQAYLDYLPQYLEDDCPMNIQMEGYFLYDKDKGYLVLCDKHMNEKLVERMCPCGVVNRSLYVGPNGAVTPCMSMCGADIESQFPNLFRIPLEQILTESTYTDITTKRIAYILNHVDECRNCEYRYRCCAGCRAEATGQNGADYFGKDPIACEMFKGGWVEKVIKRAAEVFGEDKMIHESKNDTNPVGSKPDTNC